MKNPFRPLLATATLPLFLTASLPAAVEPGYVDFGQLTAAPDGRFVEVDLKAGVLRFAARLAATQEPEAAELLNNLRHVRVNVVGLDASNKAATVARVEKIRAELERAGWERLVTVREPRSAGADDVAVFMKSDADTIHGVVVTVIEHQGNAIFVNVVGHIRAEQLAKLGEKFDIKPLHRLKVAPREAKQS
jgi:hypothetical protein